MKYTSDFPDVFISTQQILKVGLLCILILLATATAVNGKATPEQRKDMFSRFKIKYNRQYASADEEARRFNVFSENLDIAAVHSERNPLATFGINEFMDLSKEEFKVYHSAEGHYTPQSLAKRNDATQNPNLLSKEKIPNLASGSKVDWRQKGAVTAVKNQGLHCGSCYSFSTTGNIEGQYFLAGHPLTSLSEQEIVSCQPSPDPNAAQPAGGCHGGLPDMTFEWLVSAKGGAIVTEQSYPYVSGNGNVPACNMNSNRQFGARISGHHDIPHDESSMAAYTFAHGPISIGVDGSSFQTYNSGILTNCASTSVDHAVLIVGFDDTVTTPYWIIKNSWGPGWGEEGYIRVAKGSDQCLLTTAPSSSVVSGSGPQPPSPPATPAPYTPPTPPTPPSGGNYTYLVCQGSGCTNCQTYSFPQGACIDNESAGSSFKAQCQSGGSKIGYTGFPDSAKCFGSSSTQQLNTNTCYENESSGVFIKFVC